MCQLFPGSCPMNTICLPSGDQRGRFASIGGKVSCCFSFPSTLLRQRMRSGNDTQLTQPPSRENATPDADIPPM